MNVIWAMLFVGAALIVAHAGEDHTTASVLTGVMIGLAVATVFLTAKDK